MGSLPPGVTLRTEFPHSIRVLDDWITMSDGTRLAVRIWLPEDAEQNPVPALFEQIPYRMNDAMAVTETIRMPYMAGFGYACARVDIRGAGNSDGLLDDEYLKQEQDDALEAIAWLAEQPWCTGKVGMFGLSWGGFASLQVAARRPPALGAIIAYGATHDRYLDDVHYNGGCLHAGMLGWASQFFAFNGRPPDPKDVGDCWREMWLQRMEQAPAIEAWMEHQRYDDYWKHGSVKEDWSAIECPVYIVSGWADTAAYRNPVLDTLAGLKGPRKGIIGAWGHDYPDEGTPGGIGFLQEAIRWYDRWLKGVENGIDEEPMLLFWIPDPPAGPEQTGEGMGAGLAWETVGQWASEPTWPSDNVEYRVLHLNPDGLGAEAAAEEPRLIRARTTAGAETSGPGADQRDEDGRWLCFDSEPVQERFEIFGNPYVELSVAADKPVAHLAVRLCDVAPDGTSTMITRGVLNLTHRDSHERPEPLEPGRPYTVRVRLDVHVRVMEPGHRLRLAISPSYWPWIFPAPELVTLTVFTGAGSKLELPVRSPRPEDAQLRKFGPAEASEPVAHESLYSRETTPDLFRATVTREPATGRVEIRQRRALGFQFAEGLRYSQLVEFVSSQTEGKPETTEQRIEHSISISRGDWDTRVDTVSRLSGNRDDFWLTHRLEGFESGARVFSKAWSKQIPRDLV
jgi:putative CocE/NonD family hydrolase